MSSSVLVFLLAAALVAGPVHARILADDFEAAEDVAADVDLEQSVLMAEVRGVMSHLLETCVYGTYCGQGCSGEDGEPVDDLDVMCQTHDACLGAANDDPCAEAECDYALGTGAQEVYEAENVCGEDVVSKAACMETDRVANARAIAVAIGSLRKTWSDVRCFVAE